MRLFSLYILFAKEITDLARPTVKFGGEAAETQQFPVTVHFDGGNVLIIEENGDVHSHDTVCNIRRQVYEQGFTTSALLDGPAL